jgi:hypothetical protein
MDELEALISRCDYQNAKTVIENIKLHKKEAPDLYNSLKQREDLRMLAIELGQDPSKYFKDSAVMREIKSLDKELYKKLRYIYKCKMAGVTPVHVDPKLVKIVNNLSIAKLVSCSFLKPPQHKLMVEEGYIKINDTATQAEPI